MSRIRVLVVDDSVVVRRLVSEALASDPELEVVATAPNGRLALQRVDQVNPDVITMDIEMPEMDGLSALRELRKTRPKLPVVMVSTLTERAASATLDALAFGANDYITKPTNLGSPEQVRRFLIETLLPKVKALAGRGRASNPVAAAGGGVRRAPLRTASGPIEAVVIGVSTGGPNALAAVLPNLPASLPVPVFIVQHMPVLFTRLLAERLDRISPLAVAEVKGGERVAAGHAYLAAGDWHMMPARGEGGVVSITTNQGPPENSCRPAVDVLFRSAVSVWGGGVLGVVLTGMGKDGLIGSEKIRDAGGRVLAQDEATSVVWGMPGFVAQAGLAEEVLPLNEISAGIVRRVMAGRPVREAAWR